MEPTSGEQNALALSAQSFGCPATRNAWVIFQLKMKGESLAGLARRFGLSRSAFVYGLHKPYPRIEKLLAEEVGVPEEKLFPERYQNGVRIDRRKVRHA